MATSIPARRLAAAALVLLLAAPGAAHAGKRKKAREADAAEAQADAQPAAPADAAVDKRALQAEFDAVNARLAQLRERALEADPALRAAHEEVEAAIEDATRAADPEYDHKLARMGMLAHQIQVAQAEPEPDVDAIRAALAERIGIQQQLAEAHARILKEEPLASRVAEVRGLVLAKMTSLEPEVQTLIARLEAIVQSTR